MSPEAPISEFLQASTLRAFTALHQLRPHWGGALILSCNLGPQGSALALASNIAGAVCLSVEQDPAAARAALRSGVCDFLVNTLDEALRAMKNEVRRHRPLSVGLHAKPPQVLEELLIRGVAPQLAACVPIHATFFPTYAAFFRAFHNQGSILLNLGDHPLIPGSVDSASLIDTLRQSQPRDRQWTEHEFMLPDSAALRSFDEAAAHLLAPDDAFRRTWLTSVARLFPRERPPRRVLWLTELEWDQLENNQKIERARL